MTTLETYRLWQSKAAIEAGPQALYASDICLLLHVRCPEPGAWKRTLQRYGRGLSDLAADHGWIGPTVLVIETSSDEVRAWIGEQDWHRGAFVAFAEGAKDVGRRCEDLLRPAPVQVDTTSVKRRTLEQFEGESHPDLLKSYAQLARQLLLEHPEKEATAKVSSAIRAREVPPTRGAAPKQVGAATVQRVKKLTLVGYRGVTALRDVLVDADIVLLMGPNGTGKSSILEGLNYLLTGTLADRPQAEAVFRSDPDAEVMASVVTTGGERVLELRRAAQREDKPPPARITGEDSSTTAWQPALPPELYQRLHMFLPEHVGKLHDARADGALIRGLFEEVAPALTVLSAAIEAVIEGATQEIFTLEGKPEEEARRRGFLSLEQALGPLVELRRGVSKGPDLPVEIQSNPTSEVSVEHPITGWLASLGGWTGVDLDDVRQHRPLCEALARGIDRFAGVEAELRTALSDEVERKNSGQNGGDLRALLERASALWPLKAWMDAREEPRVAMLAEHLRAQRRAAAASLAAELLPDFTPPTKLGRALTSLYDGVSMWRRAPPRLGGQMATIVEEMDLVVPARLGNAQTHVASIERDLEDLARSLAAVLDTELRGEDDPSKALEELDRWTSTWPPLRVRLERQVRECRDLVDAEEHAGPVNQQRLAELRERLTEWGDWAAQVERGSAEWDPADNPFHRFLLETYNTVFSRFHAPSLAGATLQSADGGQPTGREVHITSADGRRDERHFSTGQLAQTGVAWMLTQFLLAKEKADFPSRVLLLDDVSVAYDITNITREALMWRQLAYTDRRNRVQIFLSSHHDLMSNQAIDLLAPPVGARLRVLQFTGWTPENGPTIEAYNVEPSAPLTRAGPFVPAARALLGVQ